MKITIISVGRKSSPEIDIKTQEYLKRIKPNTEVIWHFIEPVQGKMSIDQQKKKESDLILSKLNKGVTVLLDETGTELNNLKFKDIYLEWQNSSKDLTFIIGGSFGVSEELKTKADFIWSLSKLVYPHELVRLILIEQLYRTQSIIKNSPYHHQ